MPLVEATHALLFCKYHACHMRPLSLMCVDIRLCPVWGGIMSCVKDASEKANTQLHLELPQLWPDTYDTQSTELRKTETPCQGF